MNEIKHNPSRMGDITEIEICHQFLKEGYEVFKNIACSGPIDLIAINVDTGQMILMDCKTPSIYTKADGDMRLYATGLTDKQKKLGVKVVTFYDNKMYVRSNKIAIDLKKGCQENDTAAIHTGS